VTVILNEPGESRVRGYLFLLERSLNLGLPRDVARDAAREIESHVRDRIASVSASSDERAALERILAELGPPLRVAQAYSAERTLDEAVVTGRLLPIARAIWHLAVTTILGFFAALCLVFGYVVGVMFLVIGAMKPIFPNNVGFWVVNGEGSMPTSLGIKFAQSAPPAGGNWVILIGLVCGLGFLVVTHRAARKFLAWCRNADQSAAGTRMIAPGDRS
jgi:uncharacterized membrane protein